LPLRWILLGVVVTIAIGLVVASPFLIGPPGSDNADWEWRANVGQAYGGVSALLSALALCGVAASLILQRQQARVTEQAAFRERHFDIMKLALEHPEYLQVHDVVWADEPDIRLFIAANMMVSHWRTIWDLGAMRPEMLHSDAATLFTSQISRRWWASVGRANWEVATDDRRGRSFFRILAEEVELAEHRAGADFRQAADLQTPSE
jgi:hypothetical protein